MFFAISRIALTMIIAVFVLVSGSLMQPLEAAENKSPCQRHFQKYFVKGYLHTAFATTNGRAPAAPSTACGWADGMKSKKLAINAALKECGKSQKRNPSLGVCRIIGAK